MHTRASNTSKQCSSSIESTVINMAKDGDIVAKALCQLLEKKFIADGIDPSIAKIMSGRVCEVTVKASARGGKKVGRKLASRSRQNLNAWQRFIKNNKNKFKYKSGKRKGQVNMKAASAAFKKTPAGKKGKKK